MSRILVELGKDDAARMTEGAFTEFEPSLRRRLTALVRDPSAAEDLTQEAFVRLLGELHAGRIPDNMGGWLWRVASNLAASRGRHMTVVKRHERDVVVNMSSASPEEVAIASEARAEVLAAIDVLNGTGRRAVTMAAQGLSGREIADSLGRSQNATRTLLCRSRAQVRAVVGIAQTG
jgi:RNA polymerase sigma factor (sigma-70 family)